MNGFLEMLITIGLILLLVGGIVTLMLVGVNQLEKIQCRQRATKIGLNYSYGFIQGCLIDDNGWIPLKNYRVVRE